MNYKRTTIERFIDKDLLDGVTAAVSSGAFAQEANIAHQLAEISTQIRQALGDDALSSEGNLLSQYASTPSESNMRACAVNWVQRDRIRSLKELSLITSTRFSVGTTMKAIFFR